MPTEDRSVSNGGRDSGDPRTAFREEALAWIAAAEAWLAVPREPNYARAAQALSRAWWAASEAQYQVRGTTSEGISGRKALHGVDTKKAPVDG